MTALVIDVLSLAPGARLLAPSGMMTPHNSIDSPLVEGARILETLWEPELSSLALLLEAESETVRLIHQVSSAPQGAGYPEEVFSDRRNRYTEASQELAIASLGISEAAGGGMEGIRALVAEAENRFSYDHPEVRFNDGSDKVPHLSCGLTPGSCIDINTYLVASLRAASFEAGYVYGYFFREGSGGRTSGMHCWVVTQHEGEILAWDVAHHLKAGLGPTQPGLNPAPGYRVALGHSQGHRYATSDGDIIDLKLLAQPLLLSATGSWDKCPMTARWAEERMEPPETTASQVVTTGAV